MELKQNVSMVLDYMLEETKNIFFVCVLLITRF